MQDKHPSRQDRLKTALRENLKRRKAQARARDEVPPERERDAAVLGATGDRGEA
jgi:hypothetical protein